MKKLFICLFLLSVFGNILGQNTVPPVQTGGTGSMTITPKPNSSGGNAQNSSPQSASQPNIGSSKNAISIVVDHSGSMHGDPLKSAKYSSLLLVDLIALWGNELFPRKIGDMNFQYIQFGDTGENNTIHPLNKIADADQLRKSISNSTTSYGGTDFSSGIEPTLQSLRSGQHNSKVIFLTDAGDLGKGPNLKKGYYDDLDDIRFIIYKSPSSSVGSKGWLKATPNASEFHVHSEYEVLSIFVKTLFEFVDDINYYLVRQGKQVVQVGEPFKVVKHSGDKRQMLILSKPGSSGLKIMRIEDQSGNVVPEDKYKIYETRTFFNLYLNDEMKRGEYRIVFDKSTQVRSHELYYINFEKCNMMLSLLRSPKLNKDECYIENSSVNFQFMYYDIDQNIEVNYKDFLSHSAYHYAIIDNIADVTGMGKKGLTQSYSFPFGSADTYEIHTAWSYNESKMKSNNNPPLSKIDDLCITRAGGLVHLEYDSTYTWEGRRLDFSAYLIDSTTTLVSNIKELFINTGQSIITLKQTGKGRNIYKGAIDYIEADTKYTLSLENKDKRYNLALDGSSITTFLGKKRELSISYYGYDYSNYRSKKLGSIFSKLRFILSSKSVSKKKYSYTGENLAIPILLPFNKSFSDTIRYEFTLNKQFRDESLELGFGSDSTHFYYGSYDTKVGGLWGVFTRKMNMNDAVTVELDILTPQQIPAGGKAYISSYIKKRSGQMYFADPLYKEPAYKVRGSLDINIVNSGRIIKIDDSNVTLNITTSSLDRFYTLTKWSVLWIVTLGLTIIVALTYFILFAVSKYKCKQKISLWLRLQHNEYLKMSDLWSDPVRKNIVYQEFELPNQIKKSFKDPTSGKVSKSYYEKWIDTEESTDHRKIRNVLCYRSVFNKTNLVGKILYILIFPLTILVDLIRNSFEFDDTVVKTQHLLDYVRKIENGNVANIPSEWSFSKVNQIYFSFNDKRDNAIRLRHINYQGLFCELSLLEDFVVIQSNDVPIEVKWNDGTEAFLTSGKRVNSPNHCENFSLTINGEIDVVVDSIDYGEATCHISFY